MNESNLKQNTFLQKLENKFRIIPVVGETLAIFPALISLVNQYIKKEYPDFPLGSA